MTMPKGYQSQKKKHAQQPQFVTISPAGADKYAMDIALKGTVTNSGSDAVEASSTTSVINATAHTAQVGDLIRFTSGPNSGIEASVYETTANTITLSSDLPVSPATGNTFDILKPVTLTLSPTGEIALDPFTVRFLKDGVETEVNEDTVTPSNNTPLPVKLTGVTGDVNITAGDLNVQLSHTGGSFDSTRIGDGTTLLGITVANEAKVNDADANATLLLIEGDTSAIQTSAASVDTKLTSTNSLLTSIDGNLIKADTDNVAITSSVLPTGASTSALQTAGNASLSSIDTQVQAINADLDVALSTRASEATLGTISTNIATDLIKADTDNVTVVSSTLPTGAATSALQTTANTSLSNIDTSLNNIETNIDVALSTRASEATLSSLNSKVTAVDTGNVTVSLSALPTGAATSALQTTGNTSLATIAGWDTNAGAVGANTQRVHLTDESLSALETITVELGGDDVVDLLDTPVLDTSSSNIQGSAGAFLQVVASTAAATKKLQILDTTGAFIGLYTGAASSEVLKLVIGPGSDQTIDAIIPASTRISLRRLDSTTAISSGIVAINFIG